MVHSARAFLLAALLAAALLLFAAPQPVLAEDSGGEEQAGGADGDGDGTGDEDGLESGDPDSEADEPLRVAGTTACEPAGEADLPAPSPTGGDFVFAGRGWGHGVGMSQYGALGAALLGCDVATILTTYYPGVELGPAEPEPEVLRVSLWPERPSGGPVHAIRARAHSGPIPWKVPAEEGTEELTQPEGRFWRVEAQQGGGFAIFQEEDEGERSEVWSGGADGDRLRVPIDGEDRLVQLSSKPTSSEWAEGRPYKHGTLEFRSAGSAMSLTLEIGEHGGHSALERYLWGLSEMPSSWAPAALEAQAITGRSYALDRWRAFRGGRPGCHCDLYDSTSDQVYAGYLKEAEGSYSHQWLSAVNDTAGTVMYAEDAGGNERVAVGYYSSSHGGHSESVRFVWGSEEISYLRAVDDSRWELAVEEHSGYQNRNIAWSAGFSAERIREKLAEADLEVGAPQRIELPEPHGAAGRVGLPSLDYGGVRVVGAEGDRTVSGDRIRQLLGLRSTLYWLAAAEVDRCGPEGEPTDGVARVSGPERVATALAVAGRHWDDGAAPDALLATAADYPDALASPALAAALDAPLLLTPPSGLPEAVVAELRRLGTETVWVLGGSAAVPEAISDALAEHGFEVRRVAGRTRYETAVEIAAAPGRGEDPDAVTRPRVALVADDDWPAAVATGALAAAPARVPTLLTYPDELTEATEAALDALAVEEVVLVGDEDAIAAEVAGRLDELGYAVERLVEDHRYATSQAVTARALEDFEAGPLPLVLATGGDFPDALAAGALAAQLEGTVLLTPACTLEDAPGARAFLEERRERFDAAVIVGGTRAVSERVREEVAAALDDG